MNIFSTPITRRDFGKGLFGLLSSLTGERISNALAIPESAKGGEEYDFIYSTEVTWERIAEAVGSPDESKIIAGLLRSYYADTGNDSTPGNSLRNIGRLKTLRDNTTLESVKRVLTTSDFIDQLMEDETLDAMGFIDDAGELTKTDTEILRALEVQGREIVDELNMETSTWEEKSARSVIERIMPKIIGLTTSSRGYDITGTNKGIPSNHIQHYEEYLLNSPIPRGHYQVFNSFLNRENPIGISGGVITEASLRNS